MDNGAELGKRQGGGVLCLMSTDSIMEGLLGTRYPLRNPRLLLLNSKVPSIQHAYSILESCNFVKRLAS